MNKHKLKIIVGSGLILGLLLAGIAAAPTSVHGPKGLSIELEPPGHWHFGHEKLLVFTATGEGGEPVSGLSPVVVVKSAAGTLDRLRDVIDNGDGTYATQYTASEIGSGYVLGYSIAFFVEHDGKTYTNFWPVEVVRDGREDIMPEVDGTRYAYQVRYGWSPGAPHPGDEVTFFFEPRRALQTGDDINTEQPWRNTFDHVSDAQDPHFQVQAPGGGAEELTAEYAGLGLYRATYTVKEEGDYVVSLLFTDPANKAQIGSKDNAYTLAVTAAEAEQPVEAPLTSTSSANGGDSSLLAPVLIAAGAAVVIAGVFAVRRMRD